MTGGKKVGGLDKSLELRRILLHLLLSRFEVRFLVEQSADHCTLGNIAILRPRSRLPFPDEELLQPRRAVVVIRLLLDLFATFPLVPFPFALFAVCSFSFVAVDAARLSVEGGDCSVAFLFHSTCIGKGFEDSDEVSPGAFGRWHKPKL